MEAEAFEPFPRQAFISLASAGPPYATYFSRIYDVARFKSLTYWFECYYSLPGSTSPQVVAFIETCDDPVSPVWVNMTAGGIPEAMGGITTGTVTDPGRFLRIRIEAQQTSEITIAAFRMVGRAR